METISVSVKLEQTMKQRVNKLAESKRRTPHWLMKEAIRLYVEREEQRARFHNDAVRAWEEYLATGLHVSQEEAESWLTELANGNDIEPPECHS